MAFMGRLKEFIYYYIGGLYVSVEKKRGVYGIIRMEFMERLKEFNYFDDAETYRGDRCK